MSASSQTAFLAHAYDVSRRRSGDLLLFTVTVTELIVLVVLTPAFTFVDWIYLAQHLVVLGLAFTRPAPSISDHSLSSSIAVTVSYAYPYAQIAYLGWSPGEPVSASGGLVLVTLAAVVSLLSLMTLGKSFGVRPALRSLITSGPYAVVRHPIYAAYVVSDVGYNLQEWNIGCVLLMLIGWGSLLYRIKAEERLLSHDCAWRAYVGSVPYRLVPGIW